jgi:hypothetical protein
VSFIRHLCLLFAVIYYLIILVGLIATSVLIGLVTDWVNAYMGSLSAGSTKVVEKGHTLILGWSEATSRVICQMAFLRRVYFNNNASWQKRLIPWLRIKPTTPVACNPIVVMSNSTSKERMEEITRDDFVMRNIVHANTKIGRDVIFRFGDPTSTNALIRASAHCASSVVIMVGEMDEEEEARSDGYAANSATIRTVLALRNVLCSQWEAQGARAVNFARAQDLRVVVQLSQTCAYFDSLSFVSPVTRI